MKKLLLLICAVIICQSCSFYPFSASEHIVDFRKYIDKGFFITTSNTLQLDRKVTTIGIVEVCLDNVYNSYGLTVSSDCKNAIKADVSTITVLQLYDIMEYGIYDYAIARLVNKALSLGANGIMDFSMSFHSDKYNTGRILVKGSAVNIE